MRRTKGKPVTANAGAMKQVLESSKTETRLLGDIQQYMLARKKEDRPEDVLHPSEISKGDWCPRASFYTIARYPKRKNTGRSASYVLENIFDEGHEVNEKWQKRVHAMGRLRGVWKCLVCEERFEAVSPLVCIECGSPALVYKEVPLSSPEHLIAGHADGDIVEGGPEEEDPLMEVKTIGVGTLRYENPALLAEHTHSVDIDGASKSLVDLDGLWKSIKRPFGSHRRQGMLYCFCKGRTHMIYIYECKWNQQTKEFVVRFRPKYIEDILDQALDVKYALKVRKPPVRPGWADIDCKTCQQCPFLNVCYELGEPDEGEDGSDGALGAPGDRSTGGSRSGVLVVARKASVQGQRRSTEAATEGRRVVRRRPDDALLGDDEVD